MLSQLFPLSERIKVVITNKLIPYLMTHLNYIPVICYLFTKESLSPFQQYYISMYIFYTIYIYIYIRLYFYHQTLILPAEKAFLNLKQFLLNFEKYCSPLGP